MDIKDIIIFSTYINSFIVIVPGYINYSFLHYLTQQVAFFIAL
jgi:hypothetical protein